MTSGFCISICFKENVSASIWACFFFSSSSSIWLLSPILTCLYSFILFSKKLVCLLRKYRKCVDLDGKKVER